MLPNLYLHGGQHNIIYWFLGRNKLFILNLLLGGILQNGSDITIDMTKRPQGMGFARIAKLVTSKNVSILKKEEHQSNGGEMSPITEVDRGSTQE